jgi:hypothetical protein
MLNKVYTEQQINNKFDELYSKAVQFKNEHNPCKVSNNDCLAKCGFCCQGCQHLVDNKCSVKALYCRLWYCSMVPLTTDQRSTLIKLLGEAREYNILHCRQSKEVSVRYSIEINRAKLLKATTE